MEKGSFCYPAFSSEMELPKTSFQVGDVVLVWGDLMRNKWSMAKVITTYPDKEGLV